MAVVQADVKAALLAVFNGMRAAEYTEEQYADELATVIVNAIRTGDVQIGIAVQVNPTSGTGATTAIGTIL